MFSENDLAYVQSLARDRIGRTIKLFLSAYPMVPENFRLATGTGGNLTNRVLHQIVRQKGGTAMVFPHGGGIGRYVKASYISSELTTNDAYGVYNSEDRKGFEQLYKQFCKNQYGDFFDSKLNH